MQTKEIERSGRLGGDGDWKDHGDQSKERETVGY